jgi:hypothetical protein
MFRKSDRALPPRGRLGLGLHRDWRRHAGTALPFRRDIPLSGFGDWPVLTTMAGFGCTQWPVSNF